MHTDLVLAEDLAHPHTDLIPAPDSTLLHHPANLLEFLGGCLQETGALPGPSFGELGVTTRHQSLPGKVRVGELE